MRVRGHEPSAEEAASSAALVLTERGWWITLWDLFTAAPSSGTELLRGWRKIRLKVQFPEALNKMSTLSGLLRSGRTSLVLNLESLSFMCLSTPKKTAVKNAALHGAVFNIVM